MQRLSAGLEPLVFSLQYNLITNNKDDGDDLHDGGVVAGHGAAHQELAGDGEQGAQHAARHGRHAQVAVHQTCTNSGLQHPLRICNLPMMTHIFSGSDQM